MNNDWQSLIDYVSLKCNDASKSCIEAALKYINTLKELHPDRIPTLACESASDGIALEWHNGNRLGVIEFIDESLIEVTEFVDCKVVNTYDIRWNPMMDVWRFDYTFV